MCMTLPPETVKLETENLNNPYHYILPTPNEKPRDFSS